MPRTRRFAGLKQFHSQCREAVLFGVCLGLGATNYVTPSVNSARALAEQGIQEAVLLDSGFSTSLVLGQKILVTGHTSPSIPSRSIPHALVLFSKPPTALTPKPIHDLESGPVLMSKRSAKRYS